MWPTSSAGEREVLDQDVGGCDQGRAAGAVLAEQWTGKRLHTPLIVCTLLLSPSFPLVTLVIHVVTLLSY